MDIKIKYVILFLAISTILSFVDVLMKELFNLSIEMIMVGGLLYLYLESRYDRERSHDLC